MRMCRQHFPSHFKGCIYGRLLHKPLGPLCICCLYITKKIMESLSVYQQYPLAIPRYTMSALIRFRL